MALTPQELELARTLKLQGKSTDEVFNYIAGKRVNAPSRLSTVRKEPIAKGDTGVNMLTDVPQDIFTGVKQLGEGYQDRFTRLKESGSALARGEQGVLETGVQFASNIAGGAIADTAYQLLKTGASFATTPEQETKIAEGVGQVVQKVGEKTGITNWYNNLDDRTQRNVNAALDIADVLPVGVFGKVKSMFGGAPKVDATPKLQDALTRAETGDVSDATRIANATLDETTRATEVNNLAKAYQDSLVGDRTKVNRLLQEQAQDMTRGDVVMTQDDLVKALANEGIIPDIRGKLADFTTELRNLEKRQNELFKAYEPVLNSSKATASLDDIAQRASESIIDSPTIRFDITGTQNKLNDVIENLRIKYRLGADGELTAKQIDQISRDANAESKAFRDSGNKFEADVYSELGRVARQWLNDNIPDNSFRQVNDEWLRLEQLKRTAEAMQNQQVDVGVLGRALGSYVTTLTGVTLGASVGNPFMAVAAGILTKLGGDHIADVMRSTRFSPEIRAKLQERLTSDKALIDKLKETATTQENKNLFDELSRRLPAAGQSGYRSEVGSGAPIAVGGQTPTGRVEPGITERATEGAIKQPAQTGQLRKQAERFKSVESFVKAVENNPAWKKKFTEAGVTAEEIGKMVIGGGAALGLVYLLDNENLSGNGFLVMGSILGGASARTKFVKQILKNTNEADLVEMSDFVNAHKAGAYTTNNKGELIVKETKNFTKEEADKALQDALRRAEDFPVVSDASLKELRDVFDDVLKQSEGKAKGATPQTTALLEEAKKYKNTLNLQDKDDLEELGRIFGRDQIEDMKNGKMTNWRGDSYEDLARVNIISKTPQTVAQKLEGKVKEIKLPQDTFYHGTSGQSAEAIMQSGFKTGANLPENAFRGGGYGRMQNSISLAETPKEASIFSQLSRDGQIVEVKLKENAKIVSVDGIEDAIDLEDFISYLRKQKVDAVYIGGGEKELVVINPKAVTANKITQP